MQMRRASTGLFGLWTLLHTGGKLGPSTLETIASLFRCVNVLLTLSKQIWNTIIGILEIRKSENKM